ncbi:MAG: hypothetical protein IKU10_00260, partial [Clostridia bacterium]|nr:hypothetical protein [Clostridia bacterium]
MKKNKIRCGRSQIGFSLSLFFGQNKIFQFFINLTLIIFIKAHTLHLQTLKIYQFKQRTKIIKFFHIGNTQTEKNNKK